MAATKTIVGWRSEVTGRIITVVLTLYCEVGLAVVCCAELDQLGPPRNCRVSPSAGR